MVSITTAGQFLLLLTPVGLAVAAVAREHLWLLLPAALLLLVLVRTLPLCRGDEVPWIVMLSIPTGFPVNLLAVRLLWNILWWDLPLWAAILRGVLALYVLFSVETLILSLLAYLFRKHPKMKRRNPHASTGI